MSEARSVTARFDTKGAIAQLDRTQVVFDSQPLQSESLPQTIVISNVGSDLSGELKRRKLIRLCDR
jgi:hypothetical protein